MLIRIAFMMETLSAAFGVFAVSALAVVAGGIGLARYGDRLAQVTGWGSLWVGSLLVSVATSLPEVTVSIAAVWFDHSPGLAMGNVFGANMINVFMLIFVALLMGARRLFSVQKRDTELLILLSFVLVAFTLLVGWTGDIRMGPTSLGGLLILGIYLVGMRGVYHVGKREKESQNEEKKVEKSLSGGRLLATLWVQFLGCGAVVFVGGRYLAASADRIADLTGVGATFIGVLLVSLVTTLPETSVSVAAMIQRSYGIVAGNVFGSCAFNVAILFFADLFAGPVPLLGRMEPAHRAAAAGSLALMIAGYAVLKSYTSRRWRRLRGLKFFVPILYVAILYGVFLLSRR